MANSSSALSTFAETVRGLAMPRTRRARRYAVAAVVLCVFGVFWGYKRHVEPVPPAAALAPPPPPSRLDPAIAACLDSSEYLVGAARADVTGPVADISTGYNEPGVTMEGLAMKLYTRAFVIESPCSGQRIAYVNVDALHMYESLKTGVVLRLAKKLPGAYDAANVLLAATHDHSAPSNVAFRSLYNLANGVKGFDRLNYDVIVDGIVSAIVRAHDARRSATIEVARGSMGGATYNRSARAYAENRDAGEYADNVDDTMTLLKLTGSDGRPIGSLNWFAHHPTSQNHEFRLIHGDSKGYAAYRMEEALSKDAGVEFVAGFSNGAMGDVTMNAPNLQNPAGPFRRPSDVDAAIDFRDDARVHGDIQWRRAMALYREASERVHGGVFFKYLRMDFQNLPIDPSYGAPPGSRTCVAAIGAGFVSGTEEGGTVLFPSIREGELVYRGRPINPFIGSELRRCQGEKQVVLAAGDMPLGEPWVDTAVPFQILAVGNVAIAATSFEQTTMVGRRARKVLGPTLAVMGASDVVVASIANSYNMYMTTREEYAKQHFEGSFTQFGPWSAAAWLEQTDKVARSLVEGRELPKGPEPVDRALEMNRTWIDKVGVLFDSPPWGGHFGDVASDVSPAYASGHHRASATFWSAHPRTAQIRQHAGLLPPDFSFFEVQRQEGTTWVTIAVDGDPSTRFRWKRWGGFMIFPYSQITIEWDLDEAAPGRYRIVHHGVAKRSWLGADDYPTFTGTSSTFEVSSPAHDEKTSTQ